MAETTGGSADASPNTRPTLGEKLNFSLPAIAVALVLSIGISYAILSIVNGNTRQDLMTALQDKEKQLNIKIGELNKKNEDLDKEIAGLTDKTKKLDEEKAKLTEVVKKQNDEYAGFRTDYAKFVEAQKNVDKAQNEDLATNSTNIKKVEDRVHYIDEKLKKLDEVAADVMGLKTDTAGETHTARAGPLRSAFLNGLSGGRRR